MDLEIRSYRFTRLDLGRLDILCAQDDCHAT